MSAATVPQPISPVSPISPNSTGSQRQGSVLVKSKGLQENDDPLELFDKDDFDAVTYINKMFPTEGSLTGLDSLIQGLKKRISRVDAGILSAVRQQSSSGHRARQDLDKAKAEIEELFSKITEIRRKAEQSEFMVEEICRDIKKLDYAKKHLTHTITALRRLSMLVNAVDQLQRSVERHEYAEAAQLLEAVQQLFAHFQSFVEIPKVAELGNRLSSLQTSLQLNVMREFELLGTGEDNPNTLLLERLRSCCLVVDALGFKAREELIDTICRKEMGVYTSIFGTTGETAGLDRTERRYHWLRKRLKAREDIWVIFPPAWKVPQLLCGMFCNITKTQLAEILDLKSSELSNDVESLLKAVKATNDFEQEMAEKFGGPAAGSSQEEADDRLDYGADDSSPASHVRQRHERKQREKQRSTSPGPDSSAATPAPSDAASKINFVGSISSVFQKHLRHYVEAEEKQLMSTLDQLIREEVWKGSEDNHHLLKSSSDLFAVIKKSLLRCAKFVTRGQPMLDLCHTFQRVMSGYAGKLRARIPKPSSGNLNLSASASSTEWHVRMSDEDVEAVCCIVATAEYCYEMVGQLEKSVVKQLADEALKEQVDVSNEEDEFQLVISSCLSSLVLGVETRIDAALQGMLRTSWATVEAVGDQSEFVNTFARALCDVAPLLSKYLTPVQFQFFCDKLSTSFVPRYYEYIFRCKKISEAGSQQLLLDTQAMKAMLLDFPSKGNSSEPVPQSFVSYVSKEMGKSEALLKVLGSRANTVVDNFTAIMPQGTSNDFQRILELKVLKKTDAQQLLDAFHKRSGRAAALPRPTVPALVDPRHLTAVRSTVATTAAQEIAQRFRLNSAAAGDKVRETMAAMRQLGLRMRETTTMK